MMYALASEIGVGDIVTVVGADSRPLTGTVQRVEGQNSRSFLIKDKWSTWYNLGGTVFIHERASVACRREN